MKIGLSKVDVENLIKCVDVTMRSQGLEAARILLPTAEKLREALPVEQPKKENAEKEIPKEK